MVAYFLIEKCQNAIWRIYATSVSFEMQEVNRFSWCDSCVGVNGMKKSTKGHRRGKFGRS